ncbi:oligosaccharide flippase family protein [Rhodanobacter umsongensis]|uniref:Oligosaccharide flippase family protein n=1 Tax=Rhodanobacter umsongensis TaxID=633153 RepID=A0ABW0JK13_9GAMM
MSVIEPSVGRVASLPKGWRAALGAVSLLWVATATGAGMAFLTQALLAHELGPAFYGLFTSSLAMVSMIAPLAGFGVPQFWLKVYGGEGWAANRWLPSSRQFLVTTTLLTLSIIAVWAFTGAPADATATLLLLLPMVLATLAAMLLSSKLRLEERHQAMALWQLIAPGSRLLVAVMLLVVPTLAVHFVAAGYGVVSLAVTLLAAPQMLAMLRGDIQLHGHGRRPPPACDDAPTPGPMQLWSQAWAYGLAAVLYPIFFQISTVLLKYLDGNVEAGIFGIALAVMTAIYLIPATLYQKFLLSKLHRWAVHDRTKFWLVYRHGNLAMLVSGVLLAAAVALAAPWLVPLAFGEKYRAVVPVLLVLASCIPIRFLSTSVGAALLTERHMRYRVFAMGLGATVVIVLNLILIPIYHELGAAGATVTGEAVLLLSLYAGVQRFHPIAKRLRP